MTDGAATADLYLHGRKLQSVFELLGTKENDITYAVGWAISQSPTFRARLLSSVFGNQDAIKRCRVLLQEHSATGGFTDIEILGEHLHLIVEAKRGWWLPSREQIAKYIPRITQSKMPLSAIVTMSECSQEYASIHMARECDGVPLVHRSWRDMAMMARDKSWATNAEKRLLCDLHTYIGTFIRMQQQTSNMVYVVSLGGGTPPWSKLSLRQIVNDRSTYFHPVGPKSGWPEEPPNYIAFRYETKLQSIHHVKSWKIVENPTDALPELLPAKWDPHFVYVLGPAILPSKSVLTGAIYPSGRVWAMLDLLLTCGTIAEARDETQARLALQ